MKTKLYSIILTTIILGIASELTTASVYEDNKPKKKKKNSSKMVDSSLNINAKCNIEDYTNWNAIEFEQELDVTDLKDINISEKISWMLPEYEKELRVTNYRKTEDVFPYWIMIEDEPELKVLDLVLK